MLFCFKTAEIQNSIISRLVNISFYSMYYSVNCKFKSCLSFLLNNFFLLFVSFFVFIFPNNFPKFSKSIINALCKWVTNSLNSLNSLNFFTPQYSNTSTKYNTSRHVTSPHRTAPHRTAPIR